MVKSIPVNLLKDRTDIGLRLKPFSKTDAPYNDPHVMEVHRDDYYMFFLMEKGSDMMMIDFSEVQLSDNMLYYILPTQVHHFISIDAEKGWIIAVDTSLIPPECRDIFESRLLLQQPYLLNEAELRQCNTLLTLLYEKYKENDTGAFYLTAIHGLLHSFFAVVAGWYNSPVSTNSKISRLTQITRQFKNLLVSKLRCSKRPNEYAAMLNVSESYLNDVIKKTTGFPVIYWIQHEVMMEAKRLLYYSDLNVKEIAYNLGYNDHSYFSRLFRKVTGTTAITFRQQYRK